MALGACEGKACPDMKSCEVRSRAGLVCGRIVLFTLVGIHFVLPFTSVNRHEQTRIIVGSMILGALFLSLGIASFRKPFIAFATGLGLLLGVYALSAATGASPLMEGMVVKMLFAMGLGYGLIEGRKLAEAASPDVIDSPSEG